jgi:hypothetical protein
MEDRRATPHNVQCDWNSICQAPIWHCGVCGIVDLDKMMLHMQPVGTLHKPGHRGSGASRKL